MSESSNQLTFRQIYNQVRQRLGEENSLFDFFLSNMIQTADSVSSNPADWRDIPLSVDEVRGLYESSVQGLTNLAVRFASVESDPVYEEATAISRALRLVLNQAYGIDLADEQIVSPSIMMAAAGYVDLVEGPDGETLVQLSVQGHEAADEISRRLADQQTEP